MVFLCDQPLLDYMQEKKQNRIIVEVVTSDSSDFEVTELHVYLANEKQAEFFIHKKHFIQKQTDWGEVLLPPYRLEYADTIRFSLKKIWFIRMIKQEGISL